MVGVVNSFAPAGGGRNNPLLLKNGQWYIDDVAVTATAEQLNTASIQLKGTLNVSIFGAFLSAQPGGLIYEKIGDICFVSLSTPLLITNQVGFLSIITIPQFLRADFKKCVVLLNINGINTQCLCIVRPDGEMQIFYDLQETTFPNPTTLQGTSHIFNYRALDPV